MNSFMISVCKRVLHVISRYSELGNKPPDLNIAEMGTPPNVH